MTRIAEVMRKDPTELTLEDINDVLIPYMKKAVASIRFGVRPRKSWDEDPRIEQAQLPKVEGLKRRKL